MASQDVKTDVLIVGSGPIGATFAAEIRRLKPEANITMIDVGALETAVPGSHKRNAFDYQKNVDRFGYVIQGALSPVSVPVSKVPATTLDPNAFAPWREDTAGINQWFLPQNQNSEQKPEVNLAAESITRVVGGMATHWTCVCPRLVVGQGRPVLDTKPAEDNTAWSELYDKAEKLLGVKKTPVIDSVRQTVILKALNDANKPRVFQALPLAYHRIDKTKFVNWHSANTILTGVDNKGPFKLTVSSEYGDVTSDKFVLKPNVRCTKLNLKTTKGKVIESAECLNLHDNSTFKITAKIYIIAAGAVSTPQILWNSPGIGQETKLPALGKYLTDHTMAFCQIVLNRDIVVGIRKNSLVKDYIKAHPTDPVAIPYDDPEPQILVPATVATPWQGQIQRDAFHGAVPDNIDPRIVIDFRFYGQIKPEKANTLTFSKTLLDAWGMPQPTFNFKVSDSTGKGQLDAHHMMNDMVNIASTLGGFLPGAEPRLMERGSVPHLSGTTRAEQPGVAGQQGASNCVVDTNSQVLGFDNLFLGGNGVIPTTSAANPTLTSVAYAVRSAHYICKDANLWK